MHVKSIRRLKQKKEATEAQQKDLEAQKRVGEGLWGACGACEEHSEHMSVRRC